MVVNGQIAESPEAAAAAMVALYPEGKAAMKRDMDLIREILEAVEARTDRDAKPLAMPDRDELIVGQHLHLLYHAGFLDGTAFAGGSKPYTQILVQDLTMDGHDFLAVLKNDHGWPKLKAMLPPQDLARMSMKVILDLGTASVTHWAKQKLGLS